MKLIKIALFLALPVLVSCNLSKAQKASEKVTINLDTVSVDGRAGVLVKFSNMPNEKFVLEIPEIFMLKKFKNGLSNYSKQKWIFDQDGGKMNLTDGQYQYAITLTKRIDKKSVGLAWNIAVTNNSDSSLYDLAAFNCWTMNKAPLFKDTKMERTFVNDLAGTKMLLKDVEKTQGGGRRTMQFYPAKNGINLSESSWLNQWLVSAPQTLTGNKMTVMATDESFLFENIVNGKVAFFFNNWEDTHGCTHASPLIARELKPGKTASANGVFLFSKL